MKLGKILGTLLVLLAIFVFVGCGDTGVLTLEADTYGNDCLYESMTLSLRLGYQDYRDCEKVDKIVLYNKTLDKVIYETENSPYKNPKSLYEIKIDYDWVTEEEGEKVYEYYWQHGENISNTVAVKVKHYNPFRVSCDDYTAISAGSDDDIYNIQKLYYIPDVYRLITASGSFDGGPMCTMYFGEKFSDPFYLILSNYEDDKFFSNFNTLTQYVMNEGENSFTKTTDVVINNKYGYNTVNFTPTASSCKIYFETPNGDKSDVITLEKVNLDPGLQCSYDDSAEINSYGFLNLPASSTDQQRTITVSFNGNNKEMILYNNVTFEAEVISPFVGIMEKEIVLPPTTELGYGDIEPILCLKWKWGKLGTEVCDIAGAVTYVNPDNYTE